MKLTTSQSLGLDLIRGLSAQMVLAGHAYSMAWGHHLPIPIQNFGVLSFFVLSGFLVTRSVVNKPGTYRFGDYLVDRGTRIFVPYIPAIAFVVIFGFAFDLGGVVDTRTLIANLFMLETYPNFNGMLPEFPAIGTAGVFWSVAMEWWIYMGMATFFFFKRWPIWSVVLIVPGLYVLLNNVVIGIFGIVWLIGAAGVFVVPRLSEGYRWHSIALVLLIVCALRLRFVQGNVSDLKFMVLYCAFFFSAIKAIANYKWNYSIAEPVKFVAGYSYTLYLTHYTVIVTINKVLSGTDFVILSVIVANIVAIVMWFAFERHYPAITRRMHTALAKA